MAGLYVGKTKYTYKDKPLYSLTIYGIIDSTILIPFLEFELHLKKEEELWIVGYVENLLEYKGTNEFTGTGYCYLPIHLTEKYRLWGKEKNQEIFEKVFSVLVKGKVLREGEVYQHNLTIKNSPEMAYVDKFFKPDNSDIVETIFEYLFGTKELKILSPEDTIYMGSEIKEVSKENNSRFYTKKNSIDLEKKFLDFIHNFLKEYREDLKKENLGEQLRTIFLTNPEDRDIILSAIELYVKLIGGER